VAVALSFPGDNVRSAGFVNDVMFSYDGANTDADLESATTYRIIHRDSTGNAIY